MSDVDAMARECAEKCYEANEMKCDCVLCREAAIETSPIIAAALRSRDAEWKVKYDALLAEVERLRVELSKTTGDHIFEMD